MPFRFTTAGESHGPGLTAVIEGLPAGLELAAADIDTDLARRQLGHGRGGAALAAAIGRGVDFDQLLENRPVQEIVG